MHVQSPPQITKQPPTDELLFQVKQRQDENDKPFIIECEAEGEPAPKYKWIKNGKEFNWQAYDERISQQQGRGTLVVTSPQTEDIGHFLGNNLNDNAQGALQSINSSRITVDPEGTLWFSNVTRQDQSIEFMYACAAYSRFSIDDWILKVKGHDLMMNEYKLGNRVFLHVAPTSSVTANNKHRPEIQYASKRNTVAIRGTSVSLWCIIGGTPLPEIKWAKKGGLLPYDRMEYDNYGKTIKIKEVDFSDEGAYDCDATNGVGTPVSYSIQLTVYAAPYFTVEPEIQNAAEGETVEFRCEASGKPSPEIKWIHNGKPLEEAEDNPRRKVLGNRIVLENIKKVDTGNYGCNATNSFGYVYKDVYVNVLALPAEITEKPTDVVSTDGKSIMLRCRVFGAPRPLFVGGRYKVLETGDLEIRDVRFADAGEYLCDARNKFGNDSAGGTLVVKEHTKIVDLPEDYEVAAGTTATFRCSAVKDPTLSLTIDWLSDGELIDFETEPRYVKLQDNSLTIDKTTELDSGVYTCVARTEYDNATAAATLTVQDVPNMPLLLSAECSRRTSTVRWRPMGDNRSPILYYTIQYNTSFTPDTWEVAYRDVPATETSYTVSMSPWANYTFRVIARNKIGPSIPSLHSEVCLTSPDVPYKNPDNVKGHGSSPSNLVISWTPMPEIDHNAPKFKYVVQWKPDDNSSPWNLDNVNDWRTGQLMIQNQPTYRPYKIRVRAVNEIGEANVSANDVTGFSGMAEPTEAPANFTLLEKLDARTAIFSWDPVNPENIRGKFEGYKIQTWTDNDGDDDRREILIKNDVMSAVIDKLIPYSKNYVVVLAYNTDYNGPSSRVIEVVTDEGVPGPVESFDAYPLGASALYLVWRKPEQPNGILTGYRIYYQKVIGTEVGPLMEREPPIMDPEITDAKLAGLEAGTKYRIHIKATTSKGPGEDNFIERSTEPEGQTTPLNKPKFTWTQIATESNGAAAILVKWVPNKEGTGRAGSHFFVQYKRYGDTKFESTEPEFYNLNTTVRGLEPGETYVFRVVSVDGEKQKISDPEEIYTYPSDGPVVQAKPGSGTTGWFIGLIVAIAFLVLILILICIVKRNRGGKYAVYEREIAHGHLDYAEGGFREYSQPVEERSGRVSMGSDFKPPQESDTDSLGDYADDAKFTEDGSFIGQYGVKKKPDPNLPSPMATFV
ncbi:Neuroglian [Orchesella cincta]|uniref:Neuroglian n=1 Tax=Orchesella cincta TaxID=48709 RepID=A0A1D2N4A7_ORCCI|nr:Neuroglian [Orchesella cincta]